jgi:ABC-type polysaccharide/polyol phosphate transport system ATPase subunit
LLPVSEIEGLPIPNAGAVPAPGADAAPAVVVDQLSLSFSTTHEHLSTTIRHAVRNLHRRSKSKRTVDALRDVSFRVNRGSVYGVIGRNGAGKSTLFRVLAGIMPPDSGRVELYGRVTPLLSLGVGFNRELTGRENILLGGLASGLGSAEVAAQTEDVVRFAELGDAIDYPMRTYSSGMFARLGFAVAAHLRPEILLIDEALSAGDASFKDRCTQKINELCAADCTVLIVTHGVEMIRFLAQECLWLEGGRVRMDGPSLDVVNAYLENENATGHIEALVDL